MRSALGFLGWSTEQFYQSTIREFKSAMDGRVDLEKIRVRSQWEQARTLAMYIIAPHSDKIKRPEDLWMFDDEKRASRPDQLDEKSKRLIDAWDREMAERFESK